MCCATHCIRSRTCCTVVPAGNAARLNATVCKASAGAAELIHAYATSSMPLFRPRTREEGWRVVGVAGGAAVELIEFGRLNKTVMIEGNEGDGLRTLVRHECDFLAAIGGGMNAKAVDIKSDRGYVGSHHVCVTDSISLHHLISTTSTAQGD